MTLWVLARYAGTKRLNEHLRTLRQSRVNRTWLILSRKICGGRLPQVDFYFSFPIFSLLLFFSIIPRQTGTTNGQPEPFQPTSNFCCDKSNYDYVNDYKILMYMLISFRIRDYLYGNLPLHSQTALIFYTYINVFEILVASATLIVNIFILRQYVRQESRDMPRLFDDADYKQSGICSMQFESTSGSLSRRLFHPTFLLSPFLSIAPQL